MNLRFLRSFVAAYEEGSVTAAASREGATQSGVSQHIRHIEEAHDVTLFQRTPRGLTPTPAADKLYARVMELLRILDQATRELGEDSGTLAGPLAVGLMPAVTRAALAPALRRFTTAHPNVSLRITEAYSGDLTDAVRLGQLDFAIVPGFAVGPGLRAEPLARSRETLVRGRSTDADDSGAAGRALLPVRLADLPAIDIVLPGTQNTRRRTIDAYFATHGVALGRVVEMDAMIGTLELIAEPPWAAVLPSIMLPDDLGGERYEIRPIDDPPLFLDLVAIEPHRRTLSAQAIAFKALLKDEITAIEGRFEAALAEGALRTGSSAAPSAGRPPPRRSGERRRR